MNHYPCLKLNKIINLVKMLEKIKIIIKDCSFERSVRIEKIYKHDVNNMINEIEKKSQLENLEKRLKLTKNKYILLHNKLYNVIETLLQCKCCYSTDHDCRKDSHCLGQEVNKNMWETVDELHNSLLDFYGDVETLLVIETELCFHKLNKIRKIKFFDS